MRSESVPCAKELHVYHTCLSVEFGNTGVDGHVPDSDSDSDSSEVSLAVTVGLLEILEE